MKAVVDEGVARDLVKLLRAEGSDVSPFPNEWKGTKNGRLLALIRESGFDLLLTCDRNFRHQQSIYKADVALIVLPAQKLSELLSEVSRIAEAIRDVADGEVLVIAPIG